MNKYRQNYLQKLYFLFSLFYGLLVLGLFGLLLIGFEIDLISVIIVFNAIIAIWVLSVIWPDLPSKSKNCSEIICYMGIIPAGCTPFLIIARMIFFHFSIPLVLFLSLWLILNVLTFVIHKFENKKFDEGSLSQKELEQIATKVLNGKKSDEIIDVSYILVDRSLCSLNAHARKAKLEKNNRYRNIYSVISKLTLTLDKIKEENDTKKLGPIAKLLQVERNTLIKMDAVFANENFIELLDSLDENDYQNLVSKYERIQIDIDEFILNTVSLEEKTALLSAEQKKAQDLLQMKNRIKFL